MEHQQPAEGSPADALATQPVSAIQPTAPIVAAQQPVQNPELKALHEEAANWRTKFKAETEKREALEKKMGNFEARERELNLQQSVSSLAKEKGADEKLLQNLVKARGVEFDDNGKPKEIGELIDSLLKEFPQAITAVSDDSEPVKPGATIPVNPGKSTAGKMTYEKYMRLDHKERATYLKENPTGLKDVLATKAN